MAKARTTASWRLRCAAAPVTVALGLGALGGAGLRRPQSAATLDARCARGHDRGQCRRSRAARARADAAADDRRARGDARHHLHARAARGRAELVAQSGRPAAVRGPGRRPDLSLPAALFEFDPTSAFRRFTRRPQRDDRALRPARRRPAPRVAGTARLPVHRVDDTVHRPDVRLPAGAMADSLSIDFDPGDLALLAGLSGLGYLLAQRLRLPAATFVGPLLGSAAAHLAGWIETDPPYLG